MTQRQSGTPAAGPRRRWAYADGEATCTWAARLGRLTMGAQRALDDGWRHGAGPVRRLLLVNMRVVAGPGIGLVIGPWLLTAWWTSQQCQEARGGN